MYRLSGKCTSRGEREKRPMLSQLSLAEHSGVTRYICAIVHWQIVLSLICFLAPEEIKQNVWYDTFCAFRRERITAILITLPHGQPHAKMANDYFLRDKPTKEIHRNTWAEEACMRFTAVSGPSSQWFCLVQPPKHSSVPKHEWKRSSDSVSLFSEGE